MNSATGLDDFCKVLLTTILTEVAKIFGEGYIWKHFLK